MNEKERVPGNTTVAPEVLETIVEMTVNETKGVSRVFNNNSANSGVKLKLNDGKVNADIYIVLDANSNTIEVCKKLQKNIDRAIKDIVGMSVGSLNIHVEDFDYPELN